MPAVTITVRNNGPFRVELEEGAELKFIDHEGNDIPVPGPRFSLCRCGASVKKPFCDGTHSRIGFKGAQDAQQAYDAQAGARGPSTQADGTASATPAANSDTPASGQ